ncbi:MAG: peptide MFS transporter [Bacteroidetes bacterium]|nr:peptide MFS transporter [Bacteroidota bacterium]
MYSPTTVEEIQNFKGKYPKQLWYLFLVEMWERFTFYGMRALLGLYISHLILSTVYNPAPADVIQKKIADFKAENGEVLDINHPKWYIETSLQTDRDAAEAISNKRYGMINAFIYAMAFIGGLFADKLFGFRRSIFWGGTLMAIGTFIMAIPGAFSFYAGVSILIVGNGFFKPNISTMVGALYRSGDPRRDAGFSLFYSGINIGAFLSGLTIAWIGTSYSWSLGFGLAGVFMLMGLGLFIFTQKSLGPIGTPPNPMRLEQKTAGIPYGYLIQGLTLLMIPLFFLLIYYPVTINISFIAGLNVDGSPKTLEFSDVIMMLAALGTVGYLGFAISRSPKSEARKLIAAMILIFFSVAFWSFFEQGGGSLNFFANGNVESHGFNMTSVNNSINALFVIIFSPLVGLLWLSLNKRNKEPNTVVKFGLGFLFLGIGFLVFYFSKFFADDSGHTPMAFFALAYLAVTIGELCLSPIGLSIMTKLSPHRLVGVMMGTWFLASAFGQYGAGLIGAALATSEDKTKVLTNLDKLDQYTEGYKIIGIIAIVAALRLIGFSPLIKKLMGEVK